MNIELAGLSSNAMANFIGLLIGLVLLTILLKVKKLPSAAFYSSLGIIIAVFALFSLTMYQSSQSRVSVSQSGAVEVNIPLYGQHFEAGEVDWQQAKVINLLEEPQYTPSRRTNGLGLTGYFLGWFTLKNGDKALVSVTTNEAVLLVPTKRGYTLLLSVENPQATMNKIAALQE
ncbi:PH domain-containing protein [Shewanella sp. KT0246]|uniref:PH domain-containing protein n=1 Tax=Shewanella sp. KT0246 TaxID=2815912 RepID=UPI001C7D167A|nr:PH domain-containing protein [Shewanella sp. KT0246]